MAETMFEIIKECRGCGNSGLVNILDLGEQPLANALKEKLVIEEVFPLSIGFCPKCALVQLEQTVDKNILFDHYVWLTGTSKTAQTYAQIFCERVEKHLRQSVKAKILIVEIASNDGTFLKPFVDKGYSVVGIDPAQNIVQMANEAGVPSMAAYWNRETAQKVLNEYGQPSVVFARNVIPHVSELHEVIQGIADVLSEKGIGIIEFHCAESILQELHYDSIYHEHLCFFSLASMNYLLRQHRLYGFHVDMSPISGGSYVIYFSKDQREQTEAFKEVSRVEERSGINTLEAWQSFAKRAHTHRDKIQSVIQKYIGKTVVGFGASARSSTFLNFCGISHKQVQCIIDNNTLKQGLYAPGSNIPIVSFEDGMAKKPDLIFVLAWNFKDELIQECKDNGYKGDFLIPFPNKPVVVEI